MSQQSAFDRQNIEESAVIQPPGLLEQLNLPPAFITFLRKYQRAVWIVTGSIALVVVTVALYNQYTAGQEEKAASAFTVAMQAEGAEKQELLAQVLDEYGSTASGLWSRIELAHLAVEKGEVVKAIQAFNDVKNEVSPENPVTPLVLYALGALFEKNNELDKAVDSFNQLSTYQGFEASSYEAMGRLYEQQGKQAKAVEMYKKALGIDSGANPLQPGNPNQETIQARINYLQD
jgi:predicted negative regulator of RcsB-dependent stress response